MELHLLISVALPVALSMVFIVTSMNLEMCDGSCQNGKGCLFVRLPYNMNRIVVGNRSAPKNPQLPPWCCMCMLCIPRRLLLTGRNALQHHIRSNLVSHMTTMHGECYVTTLEHIQTSNDAAVWLQCKYIW